jgi:hypothetical protein
MALYWKILCQLNSRPILRYSFLKIHFHYTILSPTRASKWLFPERFPHENYVCIP